MSFIEYLQTKPFGETLVFVLIHLSGIPVGILIGIILGSVVNSYMYSRGPDTYARRWVNLIIRFTLIVVSVIGSTLVITQKIL